MNKNTIENNFTDDKIDFLREKFIKKLQMLKENGPTAKLFVQYLELITLLLQFIHTEKSTEWKLHLDSENDISNALNFISKICIKYKQNYINKIMIKY